MATKKASSKSNSVSAAVDAAVAASLPMPDVPAYINLPAKAKPFWDAIVESRARSEWSKADLIIAGQLARCQLEIEVQEQGVQAEGHVLRTDRGTPVANPRQNILEQLARRQLACMRALQMGGVARGTNKVTLANKRQMERDARELKAGLTAEDVKDQELLA